MVLNDGKTYPLFWWVFHHFWCNNQGRNWAPKSQTLNPNSSSKKLNPKPYQNFKVLCELSACPIKKSVLRRSNVFWPTSLTPIAFAASGSVQRLQQQVEGDQFEWTRRRRRICRSVLHRPGGVRWARRNSGTIGPWVPAWQSRGSRVWRCGLRSWVYPTQSQLAERRKPWMTTGLQQPPRDCPGVDIRWKSQIETRLAQEPKIPRTHSHDSGSHGSCAPAKVLFTKFHLRVLGSSIRSEFRHGLWNLCQRRPG